MSTIDKQYLKQIQSTLNKEIQAMIDVRHEPSGGKIYVGIVESFADGIAVVSGLEVARIGQRVLLPTSTERANGEQIFGQIIDIDKETISCIVFGEERFVKVGDKVELDKSKAENDVLSVMASDIQLGHVIDPFGRPMDLDEASTTQNTVEQRDMASYWEKTQSTSNFDIEYIPIERDAPPLISRAPIDTPLQTGIKAIDTMMPIGLGQRMLIIGDRGTGKSAITIACMIHQSKLNRKRAEKDKVVYVYVAIGKKISEIVSIKETLKEHHALQDSIIVATKANDPAALLYIAPFAGCSIGEYFRDRGKHAVVIYDDLSKHANAYRHISLLLKRSPGREAFPGDIFYLHSRLLERASSVYYEKDNSGNLKYTMPPEDHDKIGNRVVGTLTAFPIIETKENDYSAYVPTNVISITDGQIYLDTNLFNEEILPAVHTGLSVSRVGGAAQTRLMKKLTKNLKADLAVYKEKKKYQSFGFDLSPEDVIVINHGQRVYKYLKQTLNYTEDEKNQISDLVKNEIKKMIEVEFLKFKKDGKLFNYDDIKALTNIDIINTAFEKYLKKYELLKDETTKKELYDKVFIESGFTDFHEFKSMIVNNSDMLTFATEIIKQYAND